MRRKGLLRNRFLAWLSAAAMVFSAAPANVLSTVHAQAGTTTTSPTTAASAAKTSASSSSTSTVHKYDANAEANNLTDNTADGAILHAWCWSFDTIKDNMASIAAAGFSTIQTSPANQCKSTYPTMKLMGSDTSGGTDGCWWWQYQPTDWSIGNYQLGTEQDFKDMCAEADKYGIKIIVDVIPNHTTPDLSVVSQNLFNAAGGNNANSTRTGTTYTTGLYHADGFTSISNWSDRLQCTTGEMGGLPDVNTENPKFQDYFIKYLNELVADGCDGMRYDTGKHIGVPSDPLDPNTSANGWINNFWPVVSGQTANLDGTKFNATDLFIYGEVLQSDMSSSTMAEYQKYIGMTASSYGSTLRSAIRSNNFSASNLSNLNVSDTSKATTWVESHDTYCNDHESAWMTDEQIQLAWAVIACRGEGTPLFFSRPAGSNGSAGNYWGNNVLGAAGDNNYKSKIVAQSNFFRNAMVGESTTLSNPTGSNTLLEIARGTSGVALINVGTGSQSLSISTELADGTYTDTVNGGTWKVSNGKLSGTIGARTVALLYNAGSCSLNAKTSNGTTKFSTATKDITLTLKKGTNGTYKTSEGASGSFASGDTITIGAASSAGDTITVTLSATADKDGSTKTQEFKFYKVAPNVAWIKVPSTWTHTPYCYVYNKAGASNTAWPGAKMTKYSDGLYYYEISDSVEDPIVIFTDSDGTTVYHRSTPDMADGISISGSQIWNGDSSDLTAHDYSPANPTAAPTTVPTTAPTATPKPTATTAPAATATPKPTATAAPTATPKPTATAAPTATPKPTATAAPTATPTPSDRIDGSYDIYFVNSVNWSGTIYCYAYNPSNTNTRNASWPGTAMTKVGTDANGKTIYGYNLPDSLDKLSDVKVIFNNGSSQYPAASGSSDGLDWTAGKSYVLYSNSTADWKVYTEPTAAPTATAAPKPTATPTATPTPSDRIDGSYDIYFVNSVNWSGTIYCYAYNPGNTNTRNASWPGTAMTKVGTDANGKTIYGYNLPDSLDKLSDVKVIFNNRSSQYPAASGSTDGLDWTTGKSYVLYSNSTADWKVYTAPTAAPTATATPKPTATAAPTATPTPSDRIDGSYDIYFVNSVNWSGTIYCYAYNPSNTNTRNASWPGTAMTKVGTDANGKTIYGYNLPDSLDKLSDVKVIFNNGSSQYPAASGSSDGLDWTSGKSYVLYSNSTADWKVYTAPTAAPTATATPIPTATAVPTATATPIPTATAVPTATPTTVPTAAPTATPTPASTSTLSNAKLASYYGTNKTGTGVKKTITVDGDISDWDSSMIVAQGTANDDPRVYRPNSMYEVPFDLYTLYAAYDDSNVYLMWEMTNVQDVVAPNDNYPLSQGILYQTMNVPFFIAVDTGKSDTIGNNCATAAGGTLWDSGITWTNAVNRIIAISTNGANGPFVYGGDSTGLNTTELYSKSGNTATGIAKSGIQFSYGLGILSDHVYGLDGAYGTTSGTNPRTIGDLCNESGDWVDFDTLGHSSSTMDFHYEMAIPYDELGITESDVENNGISAMVVATSGKSGMDCLPYDVSMNDNADLDDAAGSQENNSYEKSDSDEITTSFATIK